MNQDVAKITKKVLLSKFNSKELETVSSRMTGVEVLVEQRSVQIQQKPESTNISELTMLLKKNTATNLTRWGVRRPESGPKNKRDASKTHQVVDSP